MSDFVFIKEEYFKNNPGFVEMMDPFDYAKQTQRQYLYVQVNFKGNKLYVPLRKNLPYKNPKLFFPVPSQSKPNAGLDYRKILIVNNSGHIEVPPVQRLSSSQMKTITDNYNRIEKAVINYINGYIKSVNKNRERLDSDYKFSTLHNFHKELGIIKVEDDVAVTKE